LRLVTAFPALIFCRRMLAFDSKLPDLSSGWEQV
jgi:hypothetical protein